MAYICGTNCGRHLRRSHPPTSGLAGIPIDGKTVFTSDHALKLDWLPDWVAIIGSGYIGLEFSDVYTALGCDVTFVEVQAACRPCVADMTLLCMDAGWH